MREALRRAIEAGVGSTGGARWREAATSAWASAWSVSGARSRVFVKISRHPGLLACEADGLRALAATRSVRVPAVIAEGSVDDDAWLALEWLAFVDEPPPAALGTAIATLHASAAPAGAGGRFGWHRDNRLGASVQHNGWHDDWTQFFRERRLRPQLALALRQGFPALEPDASRVVEAVDALLAGHVPGPSLLHGDLWAGNAGVLESGEAVLFDPAVYVGDREADIAMTELFGGFGDAFRASYEAALPLDDGYPLRRDLYNVYHLLNHVNLFGEAYVARTRRTLARLLAAVRY